MSTRSRFTPTLQEVKEEQETAAWAKRRAELDRRFTDARTYLLIRHHFFGRIAMRLRYVWTERVPTMAVTANMMCYMNPNFACKLNIGEFAFLLAHEICHIAYLHFDRIGSRNPELWNQAGDFMINSMLVRAGLPMPVLDERWKDLEDYDLLVEAAQKRGNNNLGLLDDRFEGMSDVEIYDILWEEQKEKIRRGQCCPECGQATDPTQRRGQSSQGPQSQASASQDGNQAGAQDGQSPQAQGAEQEGDSSTRSGQGRQRQSSVQQDLWDQLGQEQGGGGAQASRGQGGQQDSQDGGRGSQDAQSQTTPGAQSRGGSGSSAGSQHDGSTCKTCGQKLQKGGWGTLRGDADFGATEDIKREAAQGAAPKVPTPSQIRDMLIAAVSNTKAYGRGSVPAEFERWIAELRDPRLPWNHILSRWISSVLVSGQSYRRPGRASGALAKAAQMRGGALPRGVRPILPGPRPDLQPVIIGVDVSGSRGEEDLRDDLSEVFDILQRYPNPTRVIVWDAAVHFDDYVRSVDEIELRGGGGTATEPMFEAIERDPGHFGPPAALIVFTDGMASYPEKAPPYPVLWVWTGKGEIPQQPPFGEVVTIEQQGFWAAYSRGSDRDTASAVQPDAPTSRRSGLRR